MRWKDQMHSHSFAAASSDGALPPSTKTEYKSDYKGNSFSLVEQNATGSISFQPFTKFLTNKANDQHIPSPSDGAQGDFLYRVCCCVGCKS